MPQILEQAKLVHDDSVSEMNVRRSRIHSKLDPERPAFLKLLEEAFLGNDLVGTALYFIKRLFRCHLHSLK